MAMAKRFDKFQINSLKLAFEESEHLTKDKKMDLVRVTGLDMEQITSWFNRKRARKRGKESIWELQRINAELKQLLQQRHNWETKLQKELEESKRREAELEEENLRLKRRITISASAPQFDPVMDLAHIYPHCLTCESRAGRGRPLAGLAASANCCV